MFAQNGETISVQYKSINKCTITEMQGSLTALHESSFFLNLSNNGTKDLCLQGCLAPVLED